MLNLATSFLLIIFMQIACVCPALGREHREAYYQRRWCAERGGIAEYRLSDGTRCDCVTTIHAIEVEFARKWADAIGQSLYYSMKTGKRAGILLILEQDKDHKYWIRLNTTVEYYNLPIDLWHEWRGEPHR